MDKGDILENIISDLQKQEFNKIYTSLPGYESTYTIGVQEENKSYYPDLIAVKDDQIDLFSIETKIEKKVSKKDRERWRFYRIYAKANSGSLFLVGSPHNISIIKNALDTIPKNLKFIQLI